MVGNKTSSIPMISLKKTTLLAVALTAALLGACGQPRQGTANSTKSDGAAIAPGDAPVDPNVEANLNPEAANSETANSAAVNSAAAPVETAEEDRTKSSSTEGIDDAVARFINTAAGVAIQGTDPVAYFTEGKPVEGSKEFSHRWNGVRWHFASAENRDLFSANPTQYAPQYGGHCAWAAAQGYVADIDPTAWKIVNNRLFLNYNANIQRRWERDIPGFITAADENWPSVVAENM